MKLFLSMLITLSMVLPTVVQARGRLQNEDFKSLAEIQSSVLTTTGNLTSGNACIASPASTAGLAVGHFIYDSTVSTRIPSGTTIAGLPGTCSAGQIQMSQNAAASGTGDTITFGGQKSQLLNDTKTYVSANGINDTLNNAITNGQIGGSPSGVVNLLNGGFENGTNLWATYKDAAGTSPVDGTGGSPTSTLSSGCASGCTVTTTPLYGTKSGVLTHPASNVQGEGASYDFTIDPALQGKVLNINGAYKVLSGTFSGGSSTTDSDVEIYFYDKTNSVVIQPNGYKVTDGGITGQNYDFNAAFQTASNSTSYRVIFHYPNTTATAFTMAIDIAGIGQTSRAANAPRPQLIGSVVVTGCASPWNSTNTAMVSFAAQTGCTYTTYGQALAPSTNIPGIRFLNLPAGDYKLEAEGTFYQTVNSKASYYKFSDGTNNSRETSFEALSISSGTSNIAMPGIKQSISYSTAQANVTLDIRSQTDSGGSTNVYGNAANPLTINVWYFPSIASQTNDLGSQRVVAFAANTLPSTSLTVSVPVSFTTTEYDTHGGWSGSAYTAPEAGKYSFSFGLASTSSSSGSIVVYKNGAIYNGGSATKSQICVYLTTTYCTGTRDIDLAAGDVITFRPNGSVTLSDNLYSYVTGKKIMGPSQIGPMESIAASYWVSANFAASTTTPINFDSREYDTHNAVQVSSSAWLFKAPASGLYSVSYFISPSVSVGTAIYKGGSIYKAAGQNYASYPPSNTTLIRLNAGETIDLRPSSAATMGGGALNGINTSNISITRTGL